MKRIVSACMELTLKFENEAVFKTYISTLERKRIKHKIINKTNLPNNAILLKIIRQFNDYSVGDYLN